MRFEYSRKFEKEYQKAPPFIKVAFKERLSLFANNPFEPILHNHSLTGEYSGCRSINITGDWRAIFEIIGEGSSLSLKSAPTVSYTKNNMNFKPIANFLYETGMLNHTPRSGFQFLGTGAAKKLAEVIM